MVPVIDLKKLRAYNENLTPEEKLHNRQRSRELIEIAIRSSEEYKRLCEEKGIPYVPCVAAVKHPMIKYTY